LNFWAKKLLRKFFDSLIYFIFYLLMINVNGVFRVLEFDDSAIELKQVNGTSVLNFTMVDFFQNEKHDPIYFKAELWGVRAEKVKEGLEHKDVVLVSGSQYGKKYTEGGKTHIHIRVDTINKIQVLKMNASDVEAESAAERIRKEVSQVF
jgi:hypothetical protein